MESHAKLLGHPIHPMLIVFPLGLLSMAVIFDVVYYITKNAAFGSAAFWDILAGVIGGLLAAIFGAWDWRAIPAGTRAKHIGALHGGGNVVIVVLFIISWLLRLSSPSHTPTIAGFILEIIGVGLAFVTGLLGGELVDRLGVGVDPHANLDASSSIKPHSAAG